MGNKECLACIRQGGMSHTSQNETGKHVVLLVMCYCAIVIFL